MQCADRNTPLCIHKSSHTERSNQRQSYQLLYISILIYCMAGMHVPMCVYLCESVCVGNEVMAAVRQFCSKECKEHCIASSSSSSNNNNKNKRREAKNYFVSLHLLPASCHFVIVDKLLPNCK